MDNNLKVVCKCQRCGALNSPAADICQCGGDLNVLGIRLIIDSSGNVVDADNPVREDPHVISDWEVTGNSPRGKSGGTAGRSQVKNDDGRPMPPYPAPVEMSLLGCFINAFKHYADFDGRASRREYWGYMLFEYIICIVLFIALVISAYQEGTAPIAITCILLFGWSVAVFIPTLAVSVRRLHDIGKSGKWFFIGFVPFVGAIYFLILMCTEGDKGQNTYGLPGAGGM